MKIVKKYLRNVNNVKSDTIMGIEGLALNWKNN